MRTEPIETLKCFEREHNYAAVATSGSQYVVVQLELRHNMGISLEYGKTCSTVRVPYAYGRIAAARDDVPTIESNRIDLEMVTFQYMQAAPRIHIPDAARKVVAAARDSVAPRVQTSNRVLVSG